MIQDKNENPNFIDVFKKQTYSEVQYDDYSLEETIQNTIFQFNECTNDTDLEFFKTPLLMLLDVLDENSDFIFQILMKFEDYFSIFFSLLENPQPNCDFYHELISIIAFITRYLKFSEYNEYISIQFYQALAKFLEDGLNIIDTIKIVCNTFSEVDFETQLFIISLFSPLITLLPNEEGIQLQIYRSVYIMIKYIKQFEIDNMKYIIESLSNCNSRPQFSYYYSFFSIGTLIEKGVDAELFLSPEHISMYNECLYSNNIKILRSVLFVLFSIVNNWDNDNLNELFDYKQVLELTFTEKQDEEIVLGGLDFLISSAACGSNMQEYLLEFDILSIIEDIFELSSFKVRSNLSYLYINLIPRDDFEKRIMLLENQFFLNHILLLFESYKQDLQRVILNIVYHTLLKCKSFENNSFNNFLIENEFSFIIENSSLNDKKSIFYVNGILDMLHNTE